MMNTERSNNNRLKLTSVSNNESLEVPLKIGVQLCNNVLIATPEFTTCLNTVLNWPDKEAQLELLNNANREEVFKNYFERQKNLKDLSPQALQFETEEKRIKFISKCMDVISHTTNWDDLNDIYDTLKDKLPTRLVHLPNESLLDSKFPEIYLTHELHHLEWKNDTKQNPSKLKFLTDGFEDFINVIRNLTDQDKEIIQTFSSLTKDFRLFSNPEEFWIVATQDYSNYSLESDSSEMDISLKYGALLQAGLELIKDRLGEAFTTAEEIAKDQHLKAKTKSEESLNQFERLFEKEIIPKSFLE